MRSLSGTQISYWRLRQQAIWVRDKWEVSLGLRPRQECVRGRTSNEVKSEYQQGSAGQGSCLGSLQSAVNFSGLKGLNQIFKSNSKINIKVEWLRNRLDSFVICFCTWPCTKFISIPITVKLLKNRNIALVYSVTIWEQKTKDCALHGHQGAFKINYSTVVSTLMFARLS